MSEGTTGYVVGVFDLFHVTQLDALRAAARECDRLVVAVATDELVEQVGGARPFVPFIERIEIVGALRAMATVRPLTGLDLVAELGLTDADVVFLPGGELDQVQAELDRSGPTRFVRLRPGRPTAATAVRNALARVHDTSEVA